MKFPEHVAIIMDGNGRWGLKKNKTRNYGHLQGIKTVEKIPSKLIKKLKKTEKLTKTNKKLQINVALNYGSRQEIITTIQNLIKKKKKISEKIINLNLYTKNIPDPDILIRTGNTNRLSNFLLWQLQYSEIFFERKLWPDFNQNDFYKILKKYNSIKRNFGGIK